jgi:hypothetical protein
VARSLSAAAKRARKAPLSAAEARATPCTRDARGRGALTPQRRSGRREAEESATPLAARIAARTRARSLASAGTAGSGRRAVLCFRSVRQNS